MSLEFGCRFCGHEKKYQFADTLAAGWPKCCTYPMEARNNVYRVEPIKNQKILA